MAAIKLLSVIVFRLATIALHLGCEKTTQRQFLIENHIAIIHKFACALSFSSNLRARPVPIPTAQLFRTE
jgi:hypothetical protein